MFKSFYIHRHHPAGKLPNRAPRGFTALISPATTTFEFGGDITNVDHRHTFMQVAFCSPKDQFNKKEGRKFAAQAKVEKINKRDVPRMLAALSQVTQHDWDEQMEHNWYWVLKHLI